jgi:uncharacterized protein
MLMVYARRGPSGIHGTGLIARQFIPAGTVVWRFQLHFDVLFPPAMLPLLSEPAREMLLYYSAYDADDGYYVMSSDDDRFTNHADDPNTRVESATTVAVRDIADGEEITIDYRTVNLPPPNQ